MVVVLLAAIASLLFYVYVKRHHNYWKNRGVVQGKPAFLFGDIWETILGRQSYPDMISRAYNGAGNKRYCGMYQNLTPILLIKDTELIKQITVKDFEHFEDHTHFISEDTDPLWAKNLFALKGQKWKDMRSTLSPLFTSSKMKTIFLMISQCGAALSKHLLSRKEEELSDIEMKDVFSRYTNDIIASVAFGVKCNSFEDHQNVFYRMAKGAIELSSPKKILKIFIIVFLPKISQLLKLKIFTNEECFFFRNVVRDSMKMQNDQNSLGFNMIHLLTATKEKGLKLCDRNGNGTIENIRNGEKRQVTKEKEQQLDHDDITAQLLIFYFGGFDSVSTFLGFAAYELAVNPDIQQKLIQEIDDTADRCDGSLTYDALFEMVYMDQVISECLRKWPIAVFANRIVTKPYTIPAVTPDEKPIDLKLNDTVWIPIRSLHHDLKYFSDPERFDPERFNDENKPNIKPYTYLPFGSGPRTCIGTRFFLLEAKLALFHLLSHFEFVVSKKTEIPLKISKMSFDLNAENGFWMGLKRRETVQ